MKRCKPYSVQKWSSLRTFQEFCTSDIFATSKKTNFCLVKYESLRGSCSLRSGPLSFGTSCLKHSHWILWNLFLNLIFTDIPGMFLLWQNACFFGAHSLLRCCENSRFQTHIHSLRSLTRTPIFTLTGFIQTTQWDRNFTAATMEKSVCYNTFVIIGAVSGARHTLAHHLGLLTHPICSFFCHSCTCTHTHTLTDTRTSVLLFCDGNRLHATFAFMLAAYAVSNGYFHRRSKLEGVRYMFKKWPQFQAAAALFSSLILL